MTLKKQSRIWIEIEKTSNKDLLLSRIDKLNDFCRKAGIITKDQKFFLWQHSKGYKPDALGFIRGEDGSHSVNSDWGMWFNLDSLADPEGYDWREYEV